MSQAFTKPSVLVEDSTLAASDWLISNVVMKMDLDVRPDLLDVPDKLKAGHFRHLHVRYDKIVYVRVVPEILEGLYRV